MKSVPEGEGAATGSTLSTNQMSGTLINSQTMGVKLSVLQIIRDYIKNFNPYLTTGEVVEHFVKPMTKHSKCSFIQLFDGKHSSQPEPMRRMINTDAEGWTTYDFHALFPEAAEEYVSFEGAAEVFISHAWSYEFCEFVKCLDEEFAMKSNKALWIDMFSLNQWKHGHKGSRPNSRGDVKLMPSFVKGLIEDIKTTCVVAIPWKEPTVFNRTWCMWEMFCTLQAKGKLHFITLAEYAYEINTTVLADLAYITKMLHSINLYQSKSTLAEDRRAIFEAIDRMGINGESINKMIIDAINAWYKSLAGTAIQAMEKKELKDDPSVDSLATNFFSMAKRLVDSGKLADAEIMFQKALDNRVKHLGPDHSETLSVLHRMADLMGAQGSLADAERMYREVLQSREAALGTDNPETLTLLNNLAIILKTQGKLEEAEEVFASVLEGRERALGVEHPDTLSSLNNLGVVLDTMEKFDDAQEIYEEALEGRERVLGAKHPYTLGTAANLAALHFTKGNFTEAEQLYRWAFSTDEIAIGNDDMHVLANYHNFGKVLEMDGRREEALIWFQRAYEGRRELFGLNHPQTQMSLLALTDSLQETGKHEHACELMKGAFHKYYVPESGAAVAISEGFMDSFGGGFAGSEPAGLPHQQLSIASAGSSTGDWKYYGMDTGMSTGLDRPMSQESLGTHIASTASSIGQNVVPGKVLEDNSTFGLAAFNVTNSNASQHSEAASSSQQWAHNRGLGVNPTTSNPVYLNSTYPSAKKQPTKMPPSIVQDETAKAGIPGPPVSLLKGSAQPFNTKILPNSLIQSVDFKPKYDTSVSYPSGSSAYGKKPARHQVNQASVFSSTAPPAIFGMVDPGQKMRVPGVPQPKPVKSASVAPRAPVMTAPDTAFKIGSSFYPTMEPATAPTVISEQRNLQEESQADEPASAQNVYDDAFPERPQSEEWDPYQAFSRIHGGAYASNQQGLGEPSRPSSSQEPDVLFLPNVFDSDRNKLNRIVAQRMQQRLSNASNSSAEEVITQIGARRSSALDKSQTLPTVPEGTNEVTPVISTSVSRQGVPHTETASEEQVMQTSSGQTVIREVVTVYKEAPAKEIIREKIFEKIVYVEKDTNKVVKEELVEKSEGGFPSLPSAVAPSVTTTTTTVTESVASGSTKPKIIVEDSNFSAPTVKDIVASPRKSNMSSPRKSARDSIPELSLARVGLGEMPSVKKMSSDMSLQSNNSARKKPSQSSPSTMVEKSPSGLKKQPSRIKKQGSGAVVSPRSISRSGTLTPMTQGTASPRRMASRGQSSRSVDSSMTMTARDAIQYATTGGIRLTKLLQIRDIVLKIDKRMTTTQFVERIIKPLTKRQNCSFIQLIYRFRHLDRLPVSLLAIDGASGKIPNTFLESLNLDYASSTYAKSQVFVSHAYSNLFVDMIESLEATFGKNKDPVFWIDFFVRNLHLENPDMMPSTVEGIVQDIGHTAAVMIPWKNPVALKRAWCLWEMYQTSVGNCKFSIATTKADKDIIETAMSDDASLEKLKSFFNNKISFTSSSSTVSQDKVDLHMMAAKVLGAHRRVDSEIAALCAQWVITREEEVFHESVDKCEDLVYEAKVAYKNGKGEEAAEKYKKSIEMCSRLLGPQHQDTLTTMHDYGVMLHDLGNHDQAEVVLQQCVYGKEQTHGDDHEETVSSLIGLGQVYRAKKDLRTAEIHFLRAHSALKSQYGLEHPRTNDVTKLLANLVDEREDHNEEEDAQRKVLQKAEEELGPEHPDTLEAMNRMAIVYAAHGRRQKAEDLLRKTLQLRRSTLGPHHPATLSTLVSLADFLKKIRRLDESEALFREAVEIESDVPADHPTLLATMDALANLLSERGKLEEAEALYRKVFTGRMKSLGIENPKTLISITNLAVSLLNQGKAKGAEALLRRALKGKETVMGEKHPDTLTAAHHLAVCLKDIEKYDESEDMYRRVYEGRKDMLGPTHETTLIALSNLGTLLASKYPHESEDAKVELEKARTCKQEALDGFESALGKNHPSTLKAANNLAALLSLMDNLNAAEDLYRRVLKSREVNLGKNHPDTLTSLHSLATVVKSQGDVEAAIAMYERALDGREKVLGAGHPDTQRTQKALDFCYAAADPDFEPEIDASDDPLIYAIEEDQIAYENPHKPADRPSSAHI
jgi:tetratricopeptide (TPR) repeat protein